MAPGNLGFTLGLIFGAGFGLIISNLVGLDAVIGMSTGIAGGIIIGSITGLSLQKGWLGDNKKMVIPFGMGWGTLVGIFLGLLTAWTYDLSYTAGFSVGSLSGLSVGLFLGSLVYMNTKKS